MADQWHLPIRTLKASTIFSKIGRFLSAACLGLYTNTGTVFTVFTATTDWAHGLQGNDAHVVRITKNVLERLGK